MPKLVTELAQANTFSRSSEGGALADSATRAWKVILSTPNEALDIFSATGVQIGDPYSELNPVPCVSMEARADGDSRLIRIITAQYRTTAGVGGEATGDDGEKKDKDPKSVDPASRFATVQVSTSYVEMPAWTWIRDPNANAVFFPAINPCRDMYDGITRYEPVVNFSFEQFEPLDPTGKLSRVGKVNSTEVKFGDLTLFPRSTLFKACNFKVHVEFWGGVLYRGFTVSYEFAYRRNPQQVQVNGTPTQVDIGWDIAVPQTGFNVYAWNPAQDTDRETFGQPLDHNKEYVISGPPYSLPPGTVPGNKMRAMVKVMSYRGGGTSQTPSAQPVALNDDGTARSSSLSPLVYRRGQHESSDFTTLGLRLPF